MYSNNNKYFSRCVDFFFHVIYDKIVLNSIFASLLFLFFLMVQKRVGSFVSTIHFREVNRLLLISPMYLSISISVKAVLTCYAQCVPTVIDCFFLIQNKVDIKIF